MKYPTRWPAIVQEYHRFFEYHSPHSVASIGRYAPKAVTFLEGHKQHRGLGYRQFTQADVERFLLDRMETCTPKTVMHWWKALRHFCRWLHYMQKRSDDPAREVTWAALTGAGRTGKPDLRRTPDNVKRAPIIRVSRKPADLVQMPRADLAKVFASDARMNNISSKHAERLEWFAYAFLAWLTPGIAEIGRDDVIGFVDWYAATPNARTGRCPNPNTVRKAWQAVSKFCGWLTVCRVLPESPCEGLRGPRGRKSRVRPLPDDVFERAITASGESSSLWLQKRDTFIVTFLAYTGCRVGELLSLSRPDVANAEVVTVVAKGRGHEETRWIGLHQRVRDVARDYLAMRFDRAQALVINQDGTPMQSAGVRALCRRIGEAIGHPFSPHDLRRTYFTKLARSGAPWYTIKAAGGWSTMEAAEHYLHDAASALGVAAQTTFDPLAGPL